MIRIRFDQKFVTFKKFIFACLVVLVQNFWRLASRQVFYDQNDLDSDTNQVYNSSSKKPIDFSEETLEYLSFPLIPVVTGEVRGAMIVLQLNDLKNWTLKTVSIFKCSSIFGSLISQN